MEVSLPSQVLPVRNQLLVGLLSLALTLVCVYSLPSPAAAFIPLGMVAAIAVLRSPAASLLTYAVMDIYLATRGHTHEGSGVDLVLGALFIGISLFWVYKIRFLEWQPLTRSVPSLMVLVFFIYAILLTLAALPLPHHDPADALRELLNLLPLVTLPILYERYILPDSREEKLLFLLVLIGGLFLVGWNVYVLKTHLAEAVYMYQVGRANSDAALSVFLTLIGGSFLMLYRKNWKAKAAGFLMLAAFAGITMSLSRALYVAVFVGFLVILTLGHGKERTRGILQWLKTLLFAAVLLIPFLHKFKILALLAANYVVRLVSTKNLGTDLSLVNRYVEWAWIWKAIKQSPIIGYGFGTHFHLFNIIWHIHTWISFSHSSYLYMIFKTGFAGALLFFAAYLAFLRMGWRLSRSLELSPERRAIARAGCGFLVAFLVDCYAAPDLDSKIDLIWIGLLWGFFMVTERQLRSFRARQMETAELRTTIPPEPAT